VALGEPVKGLAAQEFLNDLALELDAVRAVLGHGLPSFESPARRSIPARPSVPPEGPTPNRGSNFGRRLTVHSARLRAFVAKEPVLRKVQAEIMERAVDRAIEILFEGLRDEHFGNRLQAGKECAD